MKLYRTITNHDRVPEGIYSRTFQSLDGVERVTIAITEGTDPLTVTWTRPDGSSEAHALPAAAIAELEVQHHMKAEDANGFDVSERKKVKVSFQKLTPCDILDLQHLRQG